MAPQYVIIGISGVTNGGKTGLTEKLLKSIPEAHAMYMDDYFWPWPEEIERYIWIDELSHANFEDRTAVNLEGMHKDVLKWINSVSTAEVSSKPAVLLLDGIILYNYQPLVPHFSKMFFLTLDEKECKKRRDTRTYEPQDPPGYFEKCVWPMYIKNKKEIEGIKDIVYIDGKLPPEEIFDLVHKDINELMNKMTQAS